MKSFIIYFFISFVLITGCKNENHYTLFVSFEEGAGISEYTSVSANGINVGSVVGVELSRDYKIVAQLKLKSDIRFPKDSKFTTESGFLRNGEIIIRPGVGSQYLMNNDTIDGEIKKKPAGSTGLPILDNFLNIPKSLDSIQAGKYDSLLIELRRLNDNLERILPKE